MFYAFILVAVVLIFLGICGWLGYKRGLIKSSVKFCTIIVGAITAIPFAKLISSITSSPLTSAIKKAIESNEKFALLFESNASLEESVKIFVKLIAAPLIYFVLFILLTGLLQIAYHYIVKKVKKLNEIDEKIDAKLSKWFGMAAGGLCGLALFVFAFSPFAGISNIAKVSLDNFKGESISDSINFEKIQNDYVKPLNAVLGISRYLGGGPVFNLLTETTYNEADVSLLSEITALSRLGAGAASLINTEFKDYGANQTNAVNMLSDAFGDSNLIPNITAELAVSATSAWKKGDNFLDIKKPDLGYLFGNTFDVVINIFNSSDSNTIRSDLKSLCAMLSVANNNNLFSSIDDSDKCIEALSKDGVVSDMLLALGDNTRMHPIVSELTNVGVRAIVQALDIPKDKADVQKKLFTSIVDEANKALKLTDRDKQLEFMDSALKSLFDKYGIISSPATTQMISVGIIADFSTFKNAISYDDVKTFDFDKQMTADNSVLVIDHFSDMPKNTSIKNVRQLSLDSFGQYISSYTSIASQLSLLLKSEPNEAQLEKLSKSLESSGVAGQTISAALKSAYASSKQEQKNGTAKSDVISTLSDPKNIQTSAITGDDLQADSMSGAGSMSDEEFAKQIKALETTIKSLSSSISDGSLSLSGKGDEPMTLEKIGSLLSGLGGALDSLADTVLGGDGVDLLVRASLASSMVQNATGMSSEDLDDLAKTINEGAKNKVVDENGNIISGGYNVIMNTMGQTTNYISIALDEKRSDAERKAAISTILADITAEGAKALEKLSS
ncbi:MAG: CvpA family protein, partial [Clostridia bacterium]